MISFDYFSPFDYISVDFTDVDSWSTNFEWLGHDSVQFLLGLGSIAIFAALHLLRVIISLMLKTCEGKCRRFSCCQKFFSGNAVWISSLTFIHATFFEIALSASISMRMLLFVDHLS